MKKLTILFALIIAAAAVFGQEKAKEKKQPKAKAKGKSELKSKGFKTVELSEVPEGVKSSFNSSAAGATNVRWERHTATGKSDKVFTKYVAVYSVDGKKTRSRFREDGTAMSSSNYMKADKLPEAVGKNAKSKNPGFELVGGEEIKTKKGETFYRVRMKKGSSKLTTLYDANGNEVSKDKQPEEAQEDEGDDGN